MPRLACQRGEERGLEDQVRAQHAQMPLGGMVIMQGDLRHEGIQGNRPGVIGDDQRATLRGHLLRSAHLYAEPPFVERAKRREEHVVGEVGIETEVIDRVITREAPA